MPKHVKYPVFVSQYFVLAISMLYLTPNKDYVMLCYESDTDEIYANEESYRHNEQYPHLPQCFQ